MRLIEDILSADDRAAIEALLNSAEVRFDLLVSSARLDPKKDFRHANLRWVNFSRADLRGFDFTGADLRFSSKDANTVIDETTVFDDARIDWIEKEAIPIVQQMLKAQSASSGEVRRQVLADLTLSFGRSQHVIQYLLKAIEDAKTFEEVVDFASHLPRKLPRDQMSRFKSAARRALQVRVVRSQSRTRRAATANLAAGPIIDLLQKAEDSVATQIFDNLSTRMVSNETTMALKGHALPTMDDIEKAISFL